jgi:hypothetical protein
MLSNLLVQVKISIIVASMHIDMEVAGVDAQALSLHATDAAEIYTTVKMLVPSAACPAFTCWQQLGNG